MAAGRRKEDLGSGNGADLWTTFQLDSSGSVEFRSFRIPRIVPHLRPGQDEMSVHKPTFSVLFRMVSSQKYRPVLHKVWITRERALISHDSLNSMRGT